MTRIEVESGEVGALLERFLTRFRDRRPALAEIGEALVSSTQNRFEKGRGPDMTYWKASRRARLSGGQTLVDTARLRNSINYRATNNRVVVGSNAKYAGTHQFGAKQGEFGTVAVKVKAHARRGGTRVKAHVRNQSLPWGDIPARPFLGLDREDRREIRVVLTDFMTGAA